MATAVMLMAAAGANAAISFGTSNQYPSGAGSFRLEVLHMNRNVDRIADLAVGGQGLNGLYGLGPGDFTLFTPLDDLNPGSGVVAARLDGDRAEDLAVTNSDFNPEKVSILISKGDGTFRAPRNMAAGPGPHHLAVGDFDGDGKRDVAASTFNSNRWRVLFGRGGGRFERARGVNVGNFTNRIAAGDLNGDGRDDLAAVNSQGPGLSVAYGRGNRRFRTPSDLEAGEDVRAIDIADLDGDKRRDIAVTNSVSGNDFVSVLWRKRRGFTAPSAIALGADTVPQALAAADLNGDGLRELIAGNTGIDSVSVFENTGSRTFAAPVSFAVGNEPQDVEAGKLDEDGLRDLVTVNGIGDDVSVLINGL